MAITLNGKRVYGISSQEEVDRIKAIKHKTCAQIAHELGFSETTVSDVIRYLKLRPRHKATKIPYEKQTEYEIDLKNPCYSHAYLGSKWGLTPEAIGASRKRRGLGVWRTNQNTLLERKIAECLEELDIAYIMQKRIKQWSIDFYLGHKICIDVHGQWAHAQSYVRDQRKKQWLQTNRFYYLAVTEPELNNLDSVKNNLETFYWASLRSNASTKLFVNPEAQGCPV